MSSPTSTWRKQSEIYRLFVDPSEQADFSEQAAREMFRYESTGEGLLKSTLFERYPINGFALGKKRLNIQVSSWKKDISSGLLDKRELYKDGKYPAWWLDSVFGVEESSLLRLISNLLRKAEASGHPVRRVLIPGNRRSEYRECGWDSELKEKLPEGVSFEYRDGIDSLIFLHEGHPDLVAV